MGIFTWKFADKDNKQKLKYGGVGFIACPNGAFVGELEYEGYGMFGGYDIYDLVVDWNRKYLVEIFKGKLHSNWNHLLPVAEAYAYGKSEKEIAELFEKITGWNKKEWKRNLGIAMACYDSDNKKLPYPIKVVSSKFCDYYKLPASESCQ